MPLFLHKKMLNTCLTDSGRLRHYGDMARGFKNYIDLLRQRHSISIKILKWTPSIGYKNFSPYCYHLRKKFGLLLSVLKPLSRGLKNDISYKQDISICGAAYHFPKLTTPAIGLK